MSEQPRSRDAATMAGALLAECAATSLPLGQTAHPRKRCELAVGVWSLQGEDIRAETSPSTVPLTQGQSCAWSNYGVVLKLPDSAWSRAQRPRRVPGPEHGHGAACGLRGGRFLYCCPKSPSRDSSLGALLVRFASGAAPPLWALLTMCPPRPASNPGCFWGINS